MVFEEIDVEPLPLSHEPADVKVLSLVEMERATQRRNNAEDVKQKENRESGAGDDGSAPERGLRSKFDRQAGNCRRSLKSETPSGDIPEGVSNYPGGVLLSHAVAHAVSSAMKSLTAVFGMGTGMTSSL